MNKIPIVDVVNLFLAVAAAFMLIKVAFRTEKDIDRASKCFLAAAFFFVVMSIFQVNFFLKLVSSEVLYSAVRILRLAVLISLVSGSYFLLRITERERES